jgi:hypothetical protein
MLDVIAALNDVNLSEQSKAAAALMIFYPEYEKIADHETALKEIMRFLNCGDEGAETGRNAVKLIDWEQDFKLIVAPINHIMCGEIRGFEYLHWWTFLSAFYEIGECALSQIVDIRSKRQKGKKLEKWEQEYYRQNKGLIDFKQRLTDEEAALKDEILNGA